jgi:two-component system invasion response regulator UvrY
MVKFLLIDDHELITMGLSGILEATDHICVVGVAVSGEEGIIAAEKLQPDVILMDVEMPGMGGTEACRRILEKHPDIKIIGLSQHDNHTILKQFLKIGAMDFISKNASPEKMLTIINNVITGSINPTSVVKKIEQTRATLYAKLSARESEVVRLILQGKSIPEMVDILRIKDKTINTYRYRMYDKLGIKNDVELVHLFEQMNEF